MHPYQAFEVLSPLTAEAIEDLKSIFSLHQANAKDTLWHAVEQNYVFWVQTGLLRAFHTLDGRDITSWFVAQGQFLYSAAAYEVTEVSYTHIQFMEPTTYYSCSYEALRELYQKHACIDQTGRQLLERLLRRYNHLMYLLRVLSPMERLHYFEQHYAEIYHSVPQKYVATFLGITPESLSRLRARQRKNGK
ncbi:MAG: Crp/Fnr family transcriptional regulator [Runella sp.]